MKQFVYFLVLFVTLYLMPLAVQGQCSVCTRTVQQLGEKPAGKLNAGILYLAVAPLAIAGVIGFRWWKKNQA